MTEQNNLPDWARENGYWEAIDSNGKKWGYMEVPDSDYEEWFGSPNFRVSKGNDIANWRNSLRWVPPEHEQGTEKPEWNGEGLPPVGTVCGYRTGMPGDIYKPCLIVGHHPETNRALIQRKGTIFHCREDWAFRPIKTDRDKAIEWATEQLGNSTELTPALEKLYDLGALRIPEEVE